MSQLNKIEKEKNGGVEKRYIEVYEEDYAFVMEILKNTPKATFTKYVRDLIALDVEMHKREEHHE